MQLPNVHVQLTIFACDHPLLYALIAREAPKRRARKIRNVFESYLAGHGAQPPQPRPITPLTRTQVGRPIAADPASTRAPAVYIGPLTKLDIEM